MTRGHPPECNQPPDEEIPPTSPRRAASALIRIFLFCFRCFSSQNHPPCSQPGSAVPEGAALVPGCGDRASLPSSLLILAVCTPRRCRSPLTTQSRTPRRGRARPPAARRRAWHRFHQTPVFSREVFQVGGSFSIFPVEGNAQIFAGKRLGRGDAAALCQSTTRRGADISQQRLAND